MKLDPHEKISNALKNGTGRSVHKAYGQDVAFYLDGENLVPFHEVNRQQFEGLQGRAAVVLRAFRNRDHSHHFMESGADRFCDHQSKCRNGVNHLFEELRLISGGNDGRGRLDRGGVGLIQEKSNVSCSVTRTKSRNLQFQVDFSTFEPGAYQLTGTKTVESAKYALPLRIE